MSKNQTLPTGELLVGPGAVLAPTTAGAVQVGWWIKRCRLTAAEVTAVAPSAREGRIVISTRGGGRSEFPLRFKLTRVVTP